MMHNTRPADPNAKTPRARAAKYSTIPPSFYPDIVGRAPARPSVKNPKADPSSNPVATPNLETEQESKNSKRYAACK